MDQKLPKIRLPKMKLPKPDLSKINLRKLNWLTIAGVFSYLNILFLIPLLFARKSPFVQFHVRQGIAVLIVTVIFSFTFYLPLVPWIFAIFIVVCLIIGIGNVITGRERALPLIGKFAVANK